MDMSRLKTKLEKLQGGETTVDEVLDYLKVMPFDDLGFAKVDLHRGLRKGFPEVVYCPGKTDSEVVAIIERLMNHSDNVLATRASEQIFQLVQDQHPQARFNQRARCITIVKEPIKKIDGTILIVSAGTADIDVAEEAVVTADIMGNRVERLYDVGVAGIHRLLHNSGKLHQAAVIVVVAGMEGALPSVVAGIVNKPVIAVPTSTGYGTNFGGVAPLLSMLNSCASGVMVVNIDNGFGGGYNASVINHLAHERVNSKPERSDDGE